MSGYSVDEVKYRDFNPLEKRANKINDGITAKNTPSNNR